LLSIGGIGYPDLGRGGAERSECPPVPCECLPILGTSTSIGDVAPFTRKAGSFDSQRGTPRRYKDPPLRVAAGYWSQPIG